MIRFPPLASSILLSLLLLPALATPAPAQFSATLGLDTRETQEIEILLKAGNPTKALKKTREQIELIRARIPTNPMDFLRVGAEGKCVIGKPAIASQYLHSLQIDDCNSTPAAGDA